MPGFLAAQAGHDIIRSIGIEAIHAHNVVLTTLLAEEILARGLRVTTPLDPALRTGWIGIDFDGAEAAAATLGAERVFIDYRRGCGIRVGPHFYNSDDDVRQFLRALDRAIK
jgi:kynureninase